jgi:palmitoyltransferase
VVKLVLEAGVGIAVFVRCFVNKQSMKVEIVDTLGNGFSIAPFATVVVCTQ